MREFHNIEIIIIRRQCYVIIIANFYYKVDMTLLNWLNWMINWNFCFESNDHDNWYFYKTFLIAKNRWIQNNFQNSIIEICTVECFEHTQQFSNII